MEKKKQEFELPREFRPKSKTAKDTRDIAKRIEQERKERILPSQIKDKGGSQFLPSLKAWVSLR